MKKTDFSIEHKKYLNTIKRQTFIVHFSRIFVLLCFLGLWEILARTNAIDSFITSYPSKILVTIYDLFTQNNLIHHICVTLFETFLGFILAVLVGYVIALILWSNNTIQKILEPYIVVLNSLPKIALGPIIIVWFGSGSKAIIFMAFLICVIVAIITMLNGFLALENEKIMFFRAMGASKFQIMTKLIIPGSLKTFISMLKISVGMAWIGSIMGEYLVSKAGLGYLIVYGGQVFKLDLVMASTIVLCVLASLMYALVALLEKNIIRYK